MYADYKGHYTTLCMFWTAADVFKLRLEQKQYDEAAKILEALKRMLPRVEEITKQLDSERPTANPTEKPAENKRPLPWEKTDPKTSDEQNKAAAFISSATRCLSKIVPSASNRLPLSNPTQSEAQCGEVPETTHHSEPRRGDTAPDNPFNLGNPCSKKSSRPSQKRKNIRPIQAIRPVRIIRVR